MSIDPQGSNHLLRDMASFLHFKTFYVRNNKQSYLYFHQKHTNDITRGVSSHRREQRIITSNTSQHRTAIHFSVFHSRNYKSYT